MKKLAAIIAIAAACSACGSVTVLDENDRVVGKCKVRQFLVTGKSAMCVGSASGQISSVGSR